jgi:hypothetical protein
MMSSSIQKDINPKDSPTPSLYTIKDTSVRFDTDPRLICTSPKQRERFIDEWLILERKRRTVLEKKLVKAAQAGLREKLLEMVEAKTLTVDSKWDDIIAPLRMNKDWRMLLNFDRLKVFVEVKTGLHEEAVRELTLQREQQVRVEAERRVQFVKALSRIFDQREGSICLLNWADIEPEIVVLPEYVELMKNIRGSTPAELFYWVLEKRLERLDSIAAELSLHGFLTFESRIDQLPDSLSDQEKRYVLDVCRRNRLRLNEQGVGADQKHKELLELMKRLPDLADCPPFEVAVRTFEGMPAAREMDEREQQIVYGRFCEWMKGRSCEPGEIIRGDSDWEDIAPAIEDDAKENCDLRMSAGQEPHE